MGEDSGPHVALRCDAPLGRWMIHCHTRWFPDRSTHLAYAWSYNRPARTPEWALVYTARSPEIIVRLTCFGVGLRAKKSHYKFWCLTWISVPTLLNSTVAGSCQKPATTVLGPARLRRRLNGIFRSQTAVRGPLLCRCSSEPVPLILMCALQHAYLHRGSKVVVSSEIMTVASTPPRPGLRTFSAFEPPRSDPWVVSIASLRSTMLL